MVESKEALREALLQLPEETTRDYELQVMDLAMADQKAEFRQWIEELMGSPEMATAGEAEKIAFAAFCIRVGKLRRMRSNTEEAQVMEQYRERFQKNHPFYEHLRVMCLMGLGPVQNAEEILPLATENCKRMPNAGTYHALATAVADIFEALEFLPTELPKKKWLKEGERAVDKALLLDGSYPKFYCTRARLAALNGRYEAAIEDISRAIDMERPDRTDYTLRIGEYRMYDQRIRDKWRSEQMMETLQKKMEEQSSQTLTKNMEFLGLFAGIVSFTIGSISIAGAMEQESLLGAAGLIIVLMGALLGVFAGFGVILHGCFGKKSGRNWAVLLLGIAIAAVGVRLCLL